MTKTVALIFAAQHTAMYSSTDLNYLIMRLLKFISARGASETPEISPGAKNKGNVAFHYTFPYFQERAGVNEKGPNCERTENKSRFGRLGASVTPSRNCGNRQGTLAQLASKGASHQHVLEILSQWSVQLYPSNSVY